MKSFWVLLAFFSATSLPMRGFQARTPQAALEEIATTNKPDVIVRHLPEPVQKSIEVLPDLQKRQVLEKLLSMKAERLDGCTLRHANDADAWDVIDAEGASKGRIQLVNAFFSGVEVLLSLKLESDDAPQMFIVAMHLEGQDWRIDNFGTWENTDLGLRKLVHQPTEMEKNETAVRETLATISGALARYVQKFPRIGFPAHLHMLTATANQEATEEHAGLLDAAFAGEPLVMNGYEFRYLLIRRGHMQYVNGMSLVDRGDFRITARPVEHGKTGSRSYLVTLSSSHATTENRDATEDDSAPEDPD